MTAAGTPTVERVSANDLMTMAADRGPAPFTIGALLVIDGAGDMSLEDAQELLEHRVPRVPRLRQRLEQTGPGLGRPIWVDDPDFRIERHVTGFPPPSHQSGTEMPALLGVLADLACRPMPHDRPLWRAVWVPHVGSDAALAIVLSHVLADGLGGIAALLALTDPEVKGPAVTDPASSQLACAARRFPRLPPSRAQLFADAWRERGRSLAAAPHRLAGARAGLRELDLTTHAPRLIRPTSLNQPTGPTRAVSVATAPLSDIVRAAHERSATVNDVVLAAVAGALGRTLLRRGEQRPELVMSVPVSGPASRGPGARADRLGNETGVRPMRVPTTGSLDERILRIARQSAAARDRTRGGRAASAGPLGAVFRGLARVGALQWFINHQRLVHTFVTNVRGPAQPLRIAGHPVVGMVPIAVSPGNIGVTFDVLSYAGRLTVSVVADPEVVPEHAQIAGDLQAELAQLSNPIPGCEARASDIGCSPAGHG